MHFITGYQGEEISTSLSTSIPQEASGSNEITPFLQTREAQSLCCSPECSPALRKLYGVVEDVSLFSGVWLKRQHQLQGNCYLSLFPLAFSLLVLRLPEPLAPIQPPQLQELGYSQTTNKSEE